MKILEFLGSALVMACIGRLLDGNSRPYVKLREAFADWYDDVNNEKDESNIILAIGITRATVIKDHGAVRYNMDFVNKVETEEGGIK